MVTKERTIKLQDAVSTLSEWGIRVGRDYLRRNPGTKVYVDEEYLGFGASHALGLQLIQPLNADSRFGWLKDEKTNNRYAIANSMDFRPAEQSPQGTYQLPIITLEDAIAIERQEQEVMEDIEKIEVDPNLFDDLDESEDEY